MNFFKKNRKPFILPVLIALIIVWNNIPVYAEGNGQTDENLPLQTGNRVQHADGEIVIVIDPGHGGKNGGTQSGHTIEKEMTMVTAKAMYDELSKYDNVKVYLTHTDDKDMSLAERAQFAADVGADFLYSIHYNASENHNMFGSEVWISCETPYNAYGYQFGYIHLLSMAEKGLFIRGVKNRMDEKNGNDYYGIIRESAARSVPAVIIEHCYVDAPSEAAYIEDSEGWADFGVCDALSVAKYFGLKSSSLGVDYSAGAAGMPQVDPNTIVRSTLQDMTPPDVCVAELTECNYATGAVSITVSAADYDSMLIYYNYSIDSGKTWSDLESWPGCNTLTGEYKDTFVLNLRIPDGVKPTVLVRAYNITDIHSESNAVKFDQAFSYDSDAVAQEESKLAENTDVPDADVAEESVEESESAATAVTEPVEHPKKSVGTTTFMPAGSETVETKEDNRLMTFLKISLAIVILLFFVVLISQAVNYHNRKKRRWKDR